MNKLHLLWIKILFVAISCYASCLQATVIVDITIDQPQHHYANITLNFEQFTSEQAFFHIPNWRTGRYEIINIANGIREFNAFDSQGNPLKWEKSGKNTWLVQGTLNKQVKISYQVYANQLSLRTRHIDDSHAFLDASAVVMYSDVFRDQKHLVNMYVPERWNSVSGLENGDSVKDVSHQFIAKNYDVLVDSPIETGINEHHKFAVDGRDYELVIWGKGNFDSAKIVADLKVLVQQSKHIWHDYPFKRYVFMVHATSGARGATEHVNSTIIQTSRFKFSQREDYLRFISTVAHEFVHTWNVKQYRPKGLVPYDYQQENYSILLWLSEGSTSYLQNQLLLRGKLMSSKEFLDHLAKRITGYLHKPGRKSQTIAQASFNKWIEEGGDYDNNHSVNIYAEGFLASWLLDFSIMEKTRLAKSYRDVHQQLYQMYKIPKSFDENDLLAILKSITDEDYQVWWQENINGYPQVDFNFLLSKAGLSMFYGEKIKEKTISWSGIKTKQVNSGIEVTRVEKNSPAWLAGITIGDIIVAVDHLRIANDDLTQRLKYFKPKDNITITLFRRDELQTRSLILGEKPHGKLTIVPIKAATEEQKAFFEYWTGIAFPSSTN